MNDLQKDNGSDDWKKALRSELITASIGNPLEQVQAYQEIGYCYLCCAPDVLYKYYSDETLKLQTVQSNKMWYSAPNNFNDVFDCDISIDEKEIFQNILQSFPDKRGVRAGSAMWNQLHKEHRQTMKHLRSTFEHTKKMTGVSCLSESDNSLLMWAHYANNHHGMCVEYKLLEIHKQLEFVPVPVVYSNDRACLHSLNLETFEKDFTSVFIESLTSKSLEWSYEREWRIIRDEQACGDRWDNDKKGALLDMICPNAIILGCEAKPEFEKDVKEYCEASKINLYKMEKDKELYRLNKNSILKFDFSE